MRKYANGTPFTRVYDKFEHHIEDMNDCGLCANFKSRAAARQSGGHASTPQTQAFAETPGCGRSVCEFRDIKEDCIRHGRIKRPKGWNKGWDMV
jgi:hypothetical protein